MVHQRVPQGKMMNESEPLLVARATQRDREAFAQLYNLYFDRIYRFVRLKVNNQADAEDLTSRVFLNAWRTIDRFSPKHDSSFVAWLFRLAHNALIDSYRRGYEIVSLDASAALQPDESSLPPEDDLEWRLTIMTLQQALSALTSDQREVVLLRFVGGLSAREVGDIMGKQEGTVRGLQFRALEALRRALGFAREGDILD
jgi:RNA polymerase sigma-70 factor, ECF subfamily